MGIERRAQVANPGAGADDGAAPVGTERRAGDRRVRRDVRVSPRPPVAEPSRAADKRGAGPGEVEGCSAPDSDGKGPFAALAWLQTTQAQGAGWQRSASPADGPLPPAWGADLPGRARPNVFPSPLRFALFRRSKAPGRSAPAENPAQMVSPVMASRPLQRRTRRGGRAGIGQLGFCKFCKLQIKIISVQKFEIDCWGGAVLGWNLKTGRGLRRGGRKEAWKSEIPQRQHRRKGDAVRQMVQHARGVDPDQPLAELHVFDRGRGESDAHRHRLWGGQPARDRGGHHRQAGDGGGHPRPFRPHRRQRLVDRHLDGRGRGGRRRVRSRPSSRPGTTQSPTGTTTSIF